MQSEVECIEQPIIKKTSLPKSKSVMNIDQIVRQGEKLTNQEEKQRTNTMMTSPLMLNFKGESTMTNYQYDMIMKNGLMTHKKSIEKGVSAQDSSENLYKVYDLNEERYIDIREMERDLCVIDSTTFFDRRLARKFTTISFKSRIQQLWHDFWERKDKANTQLLKAT